jgi:hypothetical protein
MLAVAVHVPGVMLAGVAERVDDGVTPAEDDAGGPDDGSVVLRTGLDANAQAATRRPTTIIVATRESEERIRGSPDGVRLRRSVVPIVTSTRGIT